MAKYDYTIGILGIILLSLSLSTWYTIEGSFPSIIHKVTNQIQSEKKVAIGDFREDDNTGKILGAEVFEEILQLDSNAIINIDGVTLNKLTRDGMPLLTYCREINSSELIYGAAGISLQRYYERKPVINSSGTIVRIDYHVV